MPVVGILFLGWKASSVLLLYFVDFLLDLAACLVILAVLDPETRAEWVKLKTVREWIHNIVGLLIAAVVLGAIFTFVFGMPVFFALGMDGQNPLDDSGFLRGLAMHVLFACWNLYLIHGYLSRMVRADPKFSVDSAVKGRYQYVTLRWVAVYAVGLFLPLPLLMVAAFCAATIYAELNPRRFAELFS